jgi:hypothetical protein
MYLLAKYLIRVKNFLTLVTPRGTPPSVSSARGSPGWFQEPVRYVGANEKRGPCRGPTPDSGPPVSDIPRTSVSPRLDPWVSRLINGRGFGPIVNTSLVTTGAKLGQPRRVQVT